MSYKFDKAVAPYNFVSFPSKVIERYKNTDDLPSHGYYDKNLNHGCIEFLIEADSPIIVGGETTKINGETHKHFFRNLNGKPTIPGSTIRGLLKTAVGILGLSSPVEDIQDKLFLYRGLADNSTKLRNDYKQQIDIRVNQQSGRVEPGKVRAGYIYQKTKDQYVIIPAKTEKGKSFYKITEMQLRRMKLSYIPINYMYSDKILDYKKSTTQDKKTEQKQWELHLKKVANKSPKPYTAKISFELKVVDTNISIKDIKKPGVLSNTGFLLCSGFIKKKTAHYVVNDIDPQSDEIIISNKAIRAYKEDLERKKQKDPFYQLPKEIGLQHGKPIFYADGGELTYFGFTPYLRVFYNGSIHDGIPAYLKEAKLDYARSMFGFTNTKYNNEKTECSYKSRLSFSDAVLVTEERKATSEKVVLGEPKATAFPHYLEQPINDKNRLVNYNDKGSFRLRGIKQYWLQKKLSPKPSGKLNVAAYLHPLEEKTQFKAKIYFSNLTDDELGLLLWAIQLQDGCRHNIGMGKPYGFGKVLMKDVNLRLENLNKKYDQFTFDFYEEKAPVDYIKSYKDYVIQTYGISLDEEKSIKEFFTMKYHELNENQTRYMTLENSNIYPKNEFSYRFALPTVFEEVEGKVRKPVSNGGPEINSQSNTRNHNNRQNHHFPKGQQNRNHSKQNNKSAYSSPTDKNEKTDIQLKLEEAMKRKKKK